MTRSSRQLLLILLIAGLVVGIITPGQLGHWVQTGASWVVDVGHAIVG